jgi:hypothetical protein
MAVNRLSAGRKAGYEESGKPSLFRLQREKRGRERQDAAATGVVWIRYVQ